MHSKMFATVIVAGFAIQAAFAGTCTESYRDMSSNKLDVNIKVKNDTAEPIHVSIWKGTATDKKTILSDDALVPSDGKEGKTDKNVTEATFYFSARRTDSDVEAICTFSANTKGLRNLMTAVKEYSATIDRFNCPELGDFDIVCEKSFNKSKDRWNVQYSIY